jgi:rare lipoprotein A
MHKFLAVAAVTALSIGAFAVRPAYAATGTAHAGDAANQAHAAAGKPATGVTTIAATAIPGAPQTIAAAASEAAARALDAMARLGLAGAAQAGGGAPLGALPVGTGPGSPDGAPPPTSGSADATSAVAAGPVIQSGIATWYGPGFVGSVTYCGEVYDQWAMTAASNTLACGTQIVVTNQNTGRSVTVRVTDRGGFGGSVILDLSQGAFNAVGGPPAGTIPVTVQLAQ